MASNRRPSRTRLHLLTKYRLLGLSIFRPWAFRGQRNRATRKLFSVSHFACRYSRARNPRCANSSCSLRASFRAWGRDGLFSYGADIRFHRPADGTVYKPRLLLVFSCWLCSRRARRSPCTPWRAWAHSWFRLFRRVVRCWGGGLFWECEFLVAPVQYRQDFRWFYSCPVIWWRPSHWWAYGCRVWPCRRCPRRGFWLNRCRLTDDIVANFFPAWTRVFIFLLHLISDYNDIINLTFLW